MQFEKAIDDLQALVRKLEGGDLSLEDSLKAFEDGVKLIRACQETLSSAEKRVQLLTQAGDTEPFQSNP
jgi:exodeoxyribonuclease VII small subunit